MTALQYYRKHGRDACIQVAQAAGTSWEYYRQIMRRKRKPSLPLADRLEAASGGEITVASLRPDMLRYMK